MRHAGRRLSDEEAALWARVAQTVAPMKGKPRPRDEQARGADAARTTLAPCLQPPPPPLRGDPPPRSGGDQKVLRRPLDRHTLDAGWDRRLAKGLVAPDFTLDLHGATLDAAYARLDHGLALALAQGARLVLLVTGRPRAGDAAGRGERRGVIRAKFLDWLAGGSHASKIAAVRPAHPRHGGAGAVYIVLRRPR